MSELPLDPLPPDVCEVLDVDRTEGQIPAGVQGRVLRRVEWTLAVMPPGGGSPGKGGEPRGGMPGGSGTGAAAATGAVKTVVVGVLAFTLGGAVGGGLHAALTGEVERPPPPVTSARVVGDAAPAAATSPTADDSATRPSPQVEPLVAPARARTTSIPASATAEPRARERDTELAAERALLEKARNELAAGQSAAALDTVERHAAQFPGGRLGEEREVLWIRALASAGRMAEARERAGRFRARFPSSMALPVVDSIVETNP